MLTIGHRGARGYIAENTLESIQKALDLNVDGIEIDVFRCASGEIVVFHDKKLKRLTGHNGLIEETTFEELKNMLVAGRYRIPTLQQVLEKIGGKILLNVELKGENTAIPTATILKQYLSDSQSDIKKLIVSSKNWKELTLFKNQNTNIPIGVLSHYNIFLEKGVDAIIEKGRELSALAIHPKFSILNKKAIDKMHSAGFLVYSWTINSPKDIQRAIRLGVDGIITDFPDRVPD
ncbi:MAG: hypothetical protein CBD24_00410 [Euryarchaeota archaeon TMED164]|nr:MAG: hypothetical protein CBD24_00410 [Euryarchaeota archaeon TMED164]|tara:strand:- start:4835 stop:5536 length:702 start_codon:yes stop_codon:yes gene_type:complete